MPTIRSPQPFASNQTALIAAETRSDPRIVFMVKLSQALHRYGVPAHRLEQGMNSVAQRLGLPGSFFATPTGIFASFGLPEEHRTSLIRIEASEVNLEKQARLDDLMHEVIHSRVSVADGTQMIDRIVAAPPRFGPLLSTLCFALASGAAARFLGGGWREILVTMITGFLVGGLALVMGRRPEASKVFESTAAILASALAMLAARVLQPFSTYLTTLASLIVLVPGLTLTVAMRELATRNLVSGSARLTGAALLFFQLGFGVALGSQVNRLLPPVSLAEAPAPLPAWTLALALLVAPLAFTVLFQARPREAGWIMLACLISFSGARAGAAILGPELGVCLGAILTGAAGNLYSRWLNQPAAITMVPALMMLVPGSLGFGSLAKFIEKDVISGVTTAFSMVLIAVALVTGLLIANVIVSPRRTL
ncbi:threonine/serine exporter family protein [candidate division KSB1 bacterium]|nr:threonine/serine exporter family protein [bacterium]NUM65259.1 threonine/serine exporter family protein [candidate division KSB1 bacterium]